MDISKIGSMKILAEQMRYSTARQEVISQNVASHDIPDYTRKDMSKAAFSKHLSEAGNKLKLKTTDSTHMSSIEGSRTNLIFDTNMQVELDMEALEMTKNNMEFSAANSTYRKFINLFKVVVDSGG